MHPIPLIIICGPTAAGKTEAAIQVANQLDGEIVSADSMQIYRQLNIGTAKPTPEEQARTKFHLIDCIDVDQPYTVADFQRDASRAIEDIRSRGHLPILCGGTGLYIRALTRGFDFPAAEDEEATAWQGEVRKRLEREALELGNAMLFARLITQDPEAENFVDPQNTRRIIRALEVIELTGEKFSDLRRVDEVQAVKYTFCTFIVNRPRLLLYTGINSRVDTMLEAGWLDECRDLLVRGYAPDLPALQAIGYRHLMQWLAKHPAQPPDAEVIELIKRDTRRYAKRQMTWFRRDEARWLEWETEADFAQMVQALCKAGQDLLTSAV